MHRENGNNPQERNEQNEQQAYVNFLKSSNLSLQSLSARLRANALKLGEVIDQAQEAEERMIASGIDPNVTTSRP
jgi:hypothetical protein